MSIQRNRIIDVAAIAALAWVAAATLHEGLGHGAACVLTGGDPLEWSTFHFGCARDALPLASRRIIAGAGTAVNALLMLAGFLAWRGGSGATTRLAGWTVFTINGLTTFGYLVFSALFGIGDWNSDGVIAGLSNAAPARIGLAVVGVAGYVAIIRRSAAMLSPLLHRETAVPDARRITTTVWLTAGVVSLLAAVAAGSDWRTTLGASIGVALGGNAGLVSIPRFITPAAGGGLALRGGPTLRVAAIVAVVAFVAILGPGVAL